MTEPPRPPRRGNFPPPLPPRPLVGEPFPKAKSEPPPLDTTPAPDAQRMRSTPPSGSLLLSDIATQLPPDDPRDALIRDLQLTVRLYREKLTEAHPNTAPSPVPSPPRSRAAVAGKLSLNLGKYTTLAVGVLGLADVVVGLWFPEYLGPLGLLKRALGVP